MQNNHKRHQNVFFNDRIPKFVELYIPKLQFELFYLITYNLMPGFDYKINFIII